MKILFYFALILVLCSCQNAVNKENMKENSAPSNNTTLHSKTISDSSSNSTTPTFNTLPPLAQYINELPFFSYHFPLEAPKTRLQLHADTIQFLEGVEDGDYSYYYNLRKASTTNIQFEGGWYGTSGEQDWVSHYQLLNSKDGHPIVLLAVQSQESYGGYQEEIEFHYNDLKELIAQGNTSIPDDEDALSRIAQDMANVGRSIRTLNGTYQKHDIRFWVWEKKKGTWHNISSQVFSSQMYARLEAALPFWAQNKVLQPKHSGFFLIEKTYSKEGLTQNQNHWKHWLGVEQLDQVNFNLNIHASSIVLEFSPNKHIRWDWNGAQYTLNNLPTPIPWKDEPCTKIDYSSSKKYIFAGKIGETPIQMEASFNYGKLQGFYWYPNRPHRKLPIEGNFEASIEATLNFYRIKNNEQRERFNGYFANCQLKGWWQHQETMEIMPFSLELVD